MILLITNMRFEEIKMMMLHFQQFTTQKKDSESFPSLIFFKNMLFLNAYLLQFSHHLEQEHDK